MPEQPRCVCCSALHWSYIEAECQHWSYIEADMAVNPFLCSEEPALQQSVGHSATFSGQLMPSFSRFKSHHHPPHSICSSCQLLAPPSSRSAGYMVGSADRPGACLLSCGRCDLMPSARSRKLGGA